MIRSAGFSQKPSGELSLCVAVTVQDAAAESQSGFKLLLSDKLNRLVFIFLLASYTLPLPPSTPFLWSALLSSPSPLVLPDGLTSLFSFLSILLPFSEMLPSPCCPLPPPLHINTHDASPSWKEGHITHTWRTSVDIMTSWRVWEHESVDFHSAFLRTNTLNENCLFKVRVVMFTVQWLRFERKKKEGKVLRGHSVDVTPGVH